MINIVNIQFCIGIYQAIFRPLLGPKRTRKNFKDKIWKKQNPWECILDIVFSFEKGQKG